MQIHKWNAKQKTRVNLGLDRWTCTCISPFQSFDHSKYFYTTDSHTHLHTCGQGCHTRNHLLLGLDIHIHSHSDGTTIQSNVGFSMLPKDTSTCWLERTANLPISGWPAPSGPQPHISCGKAKGWFSLLLVSTKGGDEEWCRVCLFSVGEVGVVGQAVYLWPTRLLVFSPASVGSS